MASEPLQSAEHDRRIDYIEFPVSDVAAAKRFYAKAFGWTFEDYGPDYASFRDGRLAGGLRKESRTAAGGPLVVLFAVDLARAEAAVVGAGGRIVKPAFSFPGGRRFHFADPSGNELAVWSDR
ncbi:MAG TPA: VOC family protein [Gemmatimonadales bacterium]|jgi:predicted enzyme related to lactoylglutathione lyase|nr:VOC family protein [Gemmatimonadales bacterium]